MDFLDALVLVLICFAIGGCINSCVEEKVERRLAIAAQAENSQTYKQGQVDALTGNVKYHLVTNHTTKEVTWELIEKTP